MRSIFSQINFFNSKKIILRKNNIGLANNIINGINYVFEKHDSAIILEDDLVVSPFFLEYMSKCLKYYKKKKRIWHISGWTFDVELNLDECKDVFFLRQMSCWGWATWKSKWKYFVKDPEYLTKTFTAKEINDFNYNGSFNNWSQILRNKEKKINTWGVFWAATIFRKKGLCVYPKKSLVLNQGFDSFSTHVLQNQFFNKKTYIDEKFRVKNLEFKIKKNYKLEKLIEKKFRVTFLKKILKKMKTILNFKKLVF